MVQRTPDAPPFEDLLSQRLSRRQLLEAGVVVAPLAFTGSALLSEPALADKAASSLRFKPIQGSKADAVILPPGYTHDVLIRWGQSLSPSVPDLDASKLNSGLLLEPNAAERQRQQFGQNCDAV